MTPSPANRRRRSACFDPEVRTSWPPIDERPRRPTAAPDTRWRTRDIVVAAVIGVAFGVVFWVWGLVWYGPLRAARRLALRSATCSMPSGCPGRARPADHPQARRGAVHRDGRGRRFRARSAALWGVDTLLSGFVQGAGAELVFAFTLYRIWTFPVLALAAIASAAAAWIHDWVVYYAAIDPGIQIARGLFMAISAVVLVAGGSVALHRALKRGGRARGVPRLTAGRARPPATSRVTYAGSDAPALTGVAFELDAGQVLLVLGPSGSGKSTLALRPRRPVPGEIPADDDRPPRDRRSWP